MRNNQPTLSKHVRKSTVCKICYLFGDNFELFEEITRDCILALKTTQRIKFGFLIDKYKKYVPKDAGKLHRQNFLSHVGHIDINSATMEVTNYLLSAQGDKDVALLSFFGADSGDRISLNDMLEFSFREKKDQLQRHKDLLEKREKRLSDLYEKLKSQQELTTSDMEILSSLENSVLGVSQVVSKMAASLHSMTDRSKRTNIVADIKENSIPLSYIVETMHELGIRLSKNLGATRIFRECSKEEGLEVITSVGRIINEYILMFQTSPEKLSKKFLKKYDEVPANYTVEDTK